MEESMAGVIKNNPIDERDLETRGVAFQFDDLQRRADRYLDDIRKKAAQILEQAKKEGEQIKSQATEQGKQAAIQAVEQSVRARTENQVKTAIPAVESMVRSLEQERSAWSKQWEQNLLKLAAAIAEKILRREIEKEPSLALMYVREALELATKAHRIEIRLHPSDVESIGKQAASIAKELGKLTEAQVVGDPTVSLGSCKVITEHGVIDQRIESQLSRILTELQ